MSANAAPSLTLPRKRGVGQAVRVEGLCFGVGRITPA
jgi:hypothetical protein